MNTQWNTPPNGDFASYVERLSAQAALPKRAPQEGEHGLDVGMTPSGDKHGAGAASAAQRSIPSNGAVSAAPKAGGWAGLNKALLIGGVLCLLVLLAFGVPFPVVGILFGVGAWVANQARKQAGGSMAEGLRKWAAEAAARQQQERTAARRGGK